jgi:ABC-2 type transport system permease protein
VNAVVNSTPANSPHWAQNYLWLIKRELWEHRSRFLITPLVVAAVILLSVFYGLIKLHGGTFHIDDEGVKLSNLDSPNGMMSPTGVNFAVYLLFSMPFLIVMFFVVSYYALDALYADRRDRSILFWKSLPLSDVETVVSKLAVATLIAPAIALVISIATQLIAFGAISVALAAHGHDFTRLWAAAPVFQNIVVVFYALIVMALWYLPIWAWCLLASAWARRAVFLWATVPIAALWFLEYETLGTGYVREFLRTRLFGMIPHAVNVSPEMLERGRWHPINPVVHLSDFLTPGAFLSNPDLWIGVAIAGLLVAATVWVRRYRELA